MSSNRPLLSWFSALVLVVLLSACVDTPPVGRAPVNDFSHLQMVAIDVADIEVKDSYRPPMQTPNIEHNMVNPPYRSAYNMLSHSFNGVGVNDRLIMDIVQASVVSGRNRIENRSSLQFWRPETEMLYKGDIRVNLTLMRSVPPYDQIGTGTVNVNRTLKVPDNMSLAEREMALHEMMERMILDLHSGTIKVLDERFGLKAR